MGLKRHFKRLRKMTGHEGIRDRAGNIWDRLPPVARVVVVAVAIYFTAGWASNLFAAEGTAVAGAAEGTTTIAGGVAEGTATVASTEVGAGTLAAETAGAEVVGAGTVLAPEVTAAATQAGTLSSVAPATTTTLGEVGAIGQAAATPAAAAFVPAVESGLTTGQALLAGQALQTVGGALAAPDDPGRPRTTFAAPARTGEVTSQGVRIQRQQERVAPVGALDREARRVPVNVASLSKRREEDRLLQSIK